MKPMKEVDDYIRNLDSRQSELAGTLRKLVTENFPQLIEEFKWNQPVYTLGGKDVVYFVATKHGVNFGITNGAQLDDPKGVLEGTGKNMRHVKLTSVEQLDPDYLTQLVSQAVGNI